MLPYAACAEALEAARSVLITTHIGPDGDGIGTGLALLLALERLGKTVRFVIPSKVVPIYQFLPGAGRIEVVDEPAAAAALPRADVVVSCDAGDKERLGAVWHCPRGQFINLDHHATNTRFGDLNLVDIDGESSGVVAHGLLAALGVAIDRDIAACLYTTIVYDTGRFMHSNTTPRCLRWTADLMETGIDAAEINRRLTYTKTAKDLAATSIALSHLKVDDAEPRLAGIMLDEATIAAAGDPDDWGDLVEWPRSLLGNQVAFVLKEKKQKDGTWVVKASLRANPPYAVGAVAQSFGGGGHVLAAGATIPGRMPEIAPQVLARLRAAVAAVTPA
jgi:phosphoesterase RecJ-like protein